MLTLPGAPVGEVSTRAGIICAIGVVVERFAFGALERRTVEVWGLKREA